MTTEEFPCIVREELPLAPAFSLSTMPPPTRSSLTVPAFIVKEVLHNRSLSPELRKLVKGVMIESYIEPGRQDVSEHIYGKSITDPCLGWDASERLLYDIAEQC